MALPKGRWKPDDSFHDIVDGEFRGVKRVKDALAELRLKMGNKIVTSRDKKMQPLVEKLRRTTMPKGFEQWQLPIVLGGRNRPVMLFITLGLPNAIVPEHRHPQDSVFRMVMSGSILYKRLELVAGDWMYVPEGQSYSFQAGRLGCTVAHIYN
jgi:hypothetical protein